jgi:hypothetical protein
LDERTEEAGKLYEWAFETALHEPISLLAGVSEVYSLGYGAATQPIVAMSHQAIKSRPANRTAVIENR